MFQAFKMCHPNRELQADSLYVLIWRISGISGSLLAADLNVPEALLAVHVILDDKISINECAVTSWTFPLLLHSW